MAQFQDLNLPSGSFITMPKGDLASRSNSLGEGSLQYNTSTGELEGQAGSRWVNLGKKPVKNITRGLELLYDFYNPETYPNEGAACFDISSNERDGSLQNVDFNQNEKSIIFNNAEVPEQIVVPHDNNISENVFGDTDATIEAWVKVKSYINYAPVLTKAVGGSWSNNTFSIWIYGNQRIRAIVGTNRSGNPSGSYSTVDFSAQPIDTWMHLVATVEGSLLSFTIYNTATDTAVTQTQNISLSYPRVTNTGNITIGTRLENNNDNMDAEIGMVAAYSRALSSVEIEYQRALRLERYI